MQKLMVITSLALSLLCAQSQAKDTFLIGIEADKEKQIQPVNGGRYLPILEAVLQAFAMKEGIKMEYVALPNEQYTQWFSENRIDFRFPDHPRWSAAQSSLFYSQPVISLCEVTRMKPQNSWMRQPDVKSLGVLPNVPLSSDWQAQIKRGQTTLTTYQTEKALVNALVSGEVDAILGEKAQIDSGVKALGIARNTVVPSEFIQDEKSSLRVSSEQYPAMLEKLDLFLNTHQGLIAQLSRKYHIDNGRSCAQRELKYQSDLAD